MFGTRQLDASQLLKIKHQTRITAVGGDLFDSLFTAQERALGSLTGKASNRYDSYIPKKQLDMDVIDGIIGKLLASIEGAFPWLIPKLLFLFRYMFWRPKFL